MTSSYPRLLTTMTFGQLVKHLARLRDYLGNPLQAALVDRLQSDLTCVTAGGKEYVITPHQMEFHVSIPKKLLCDPDSALLEEYEDAQMGEKEKKEDPFEKIDSALEESLLADQDVPTDEEDVPTDEEESLLADPKNVQTDEQINKMFDKFAAARINKS